MLLEYGYDQRMNSYFFINLSQIEKLLSLLKPSHNDLNILRTLQLLELIHWLDFSDVTWIVAPIGELLLVVGQELLDVVVDRLSVFLAGLDDAHLHEDDLLGRRRRDPVELGRQERSEGLSLHDHDVVLATVPASRGQGLEKKDQKD